MKRIGYKQYIAEYIFRLPFNIPIYTEDIAFNLAGHFSIEVGQAKTAQNGENDHSRRCMAITKGEKAPVQILYIN